MDNEQNEQKDFVTSSDYIFSTPSEFEKERLRLLNELYIHTQKKYYRELYCQE